MGNPEVEGEDAEAAGVGTTHEEAEGAGVAGPFPIPGVWTPRFHLVSAVLPAQLKTSGNPAAAPVCTLDDRISDALVASTPCPNSPG